MKSLRWNNCSTRHVPSTRSVTIGKDSSLSSIRELDLTDSGVDDSTIDRLIAPLADNAILQRFKLRRNPSITPRGWATLMPFLQSCKLTSLDLSHNLIDDDIAIQLAHSLANNDTLKKLDLSHNEHITSTGLAAFALLFQSPVTRLESFHLIGNTVCDDVAVALANSLSDNRTLKKLWLGRGNLITSRGLLAFSSLLQNNPNCQLNVLNFSRCHVQDDAAVALATSLVGNTKMKYLNLGEATSVTATGGWAAFLHLLCNASSFDSIYDSNHTLGLLGFGLSQQLPPEASSSAATVEKYLEYNRMGGEQRSRQRKILDHYFCGDFSMEPFAHMEVQLLVHILAWISRLGCNSARRGTFALEHEIRCQSAMFNFMRSEPRVTDLVIRSHQRARAGDELLVSWDDMDSSPSNFSWSSVWKQLLCIFHDNEVDKQPKQATTSSPAAKKKRVKKEESVGFMLYGDSMNDQVDQQIDFMLELMDDDDCDDNLEDLRIICIDDDDHKGHTKLNEVINSLPASMWK